MALLDLLGRRWVLRVLWELRQPVANFRELQRRCDDSELRDAGLVASEPGGGYALTSHGAELLDVLLPLNEWADRWARRQGRRA